jgi:hypothetical protein
MVWYGIGLTLTYSTTTVCPSDVTTTHQATIYIICDPTATTPRVLGRVREQGCDYRITLQSSAACYPQPGTHPSVCMHAI